MGASRSRTRERAAPEAEHAQRLVRAAEAQARADLDRAHHVRSVEVQPARAHVTLNLEPLACCDHSAPQLAALRAEYVRLAHHELQALRTERLHAPARGVDR